MREKEFEILYNGITKSENLIHNSRNLLYTVVAAIFAFVFTQGTVNPFYFLTPFFVVIPVYYISISYIKSCFRIAAYLIVFYERDSDIQWQTRLFNLRIRHKNNGRGRYVNYDSLPYLFLSLICLVLYFYSLFANQCIRVFSFEFIIGFSVVFIVILITLTQKTSSAMEEDYIKQWEKIRDIELNKKNQQ